MELILIWFLIFGSSAFANRTQKSITYTVKNPKGDYKLNGIFLSDTTFKNPPLVLLSHGAPFTPASAHSFYPEGMINPGNDFLKLGFAVLIPERRGYGRSKEKFGEIVGDCEHSDYVASGESSTADILGSLDYAQKSLAIDASQILFVGHSAGGFASLVAGASEHKGLKGIISFGGGRGIYNEKSSICNLPSFLKVLAAAGANDSVPTLWIYAKNDELFPPALAQKMYQAYTADRGLADLQFVGDYGHGALFNPKARPLWQPLVKGFLKKIDLCPKCE